MGFWLVRNNSKRELVELIENFNLNDFKLIVTLTASSSWIQKSFLNLGTGTGPVSWIL